MTDSEPTNIVTGKKETKWEKAKGNLSVLALVLWLFVAPVIGLIIIFAVFSFIVGPFIEALFNIKL